jgi:hypothetical protein
VERLFYNQASAGVQMQNWKRAVVAGSLGTGAVLFLKGKKPAGVLLAGIGLATLASEYPEQFQRFREDLPDYVDRGTRFLDLVSRLGERLADVTERSGRAAWREITR